MIILIWFAFEKLYKIDKVIEENTNTKGKVKKILRTINMFFSSSSIGE